jgi:multiple sugar transport system substrate-binding protein
MKKLATTIFSCSMAIALAGCGSAATSSSATASTTSGELTIIYSGTPEVHEKEYLMNEYFKNFEDEYGVEVTVDFVAQADAIKKIQSEQETGNIVHDVIYADTANMSPYINGGWMEDITELVESTGSTYTTMFDSITNKDGVRYFVPNSFDVYIVLANKKALDYLPDGVTEEDVVNGMTWEEYADWAINIAEGEGVGKTMMPASLENSQLLYPMAGMSLAYGGGFPDFTSDGFKDAMAIIAKMAAGNAFYPEQDQYTAVTEPMNSGDVWLAFSHMAPAGTSYNAAPNNYVVGAAPKGSAGAGSTSGAWCYGIQKGAPNEELAEKFIEYIARPDVNYAFCSNYGGALSPIEEVSDEVSDDDAIMKAGLNMLDDTIISGVPSTDYSDWNAVKLLYGDVFNEILSTGEVPSDSYLEDIQSQLEALKVE